MTDKTTEELISYLQLRLDADGLDYYEAVMIEDLMASLTNTREAEAKHSPTSRDNIAVPPRPPSDGR